LSFKFSSCPDVLIRGVFVVFSVESSLSKSATTPTYGLYVKYIEPIADTFVYVLLRNHFHLLVRIKDPSDLAGRG